jgi:CDP-glycerol glycerophosphotransferase
MPVHDVEAYLPQALESVLAQTGVELDVVVVDDGSSDGSGAVADGYAARDPRVRVVHTANRGLGAARNEGLRHVRGDLVGFADSDDVVPPGSYALLAAAAVAEGADLVTGSMARWDGSRSVEGAGLTELPWMRRLHRERRTCTVDDHPEILGDVFAPNKLFRRDFWDRLDLSWPEGVRYEDQPTTTRAFVGAARFTVLPEVVYHWRVRTDGSSITQQRSSLQDLRDRWTTKRMSLATVERHASTQVRQVFVDRVLAGDLHRYFVEIPGCSDEWWELLAGGVRELWGQRSLVHSGLTPVHRLTGWLVEQGRRDDAAAVMEYAAALGRPLPRVRDAAGARLDVPPSVLDTATVDPAALALRDHEVGRPAPRTPDPA